MTGTNWAHGIAENPEFWYEQMDIHYPKMLKSMYGEIRQLAVDGSTYGMLLELRCLFEALIRWYVLIGIAYADFQEEKQLVALLFDPDRSLSFGDWVQVFPRKLAQDTRVGSNSLGSLLTNLYKCYNRAKVVSWRNETIGHGALQPETSQTFQAEIERMLLTLKQCLEDNAQLASKVSCQIKPDGLLYCTIDNGEEFTLTPFIHWANGEYRLFDSLRDSEKQTCLELSYLTGIRTQRREPYFFDLRSRYYGSIPFAVKGSFDDDVFTEQMENTLCHYHEPQRYWKQPHYMQALMDFMDRNDRGVLLFQSESGTGKSTFCHYIDGLGKCKFERQNIICRCYPCSRTSFRSYKEFFRALQDMFCVVPEEDTDLRGATPALIPNTAGMTPSKIMAEFLNEFRRLYSRKFGRERLLLILDGIDELSPEATGLLNFVPAPDALEQGVYVLITCRLEGIAGTYQWDFLQTYPFGDKRTFNKAQENREVLKKAVGDSIFLSGEVLNAEQIDRVCSLLDNRFTGLSVARAVLSQTTNFEDAFRAQSLLDAYIQFLLRLYGKNIFSRAQRVLLSIALAYEPLSVRQIASLAFDEPPTVELLAILRDLAPILLSVRDNQGTKYIIGHPEFGSQLRTRFQTDCAELVSAWQDRLAVEFNPASSDYEQDTYIAGGMYLWSSDILKQQLDSKFLNLMGQIGGNYSQARNSGLHISRIVRIMSGVKSGYVALWEKTHDIQIAAFAIDAITTCLHKLMQLEDMHGCEQAQAESEKLISELPEGCQDNAGLVPVLFANYANRSIVAESFGDIQKAQELHDRAAELLFAHPEWIRNEHQIPFIHNCAVSLLQENPDATIGICNTELSFSEATVFQRIRAFTLKSDALIIQKNYPAAGACLEKAVDLARHAVPQRADEVLTYPNTLLHYGRYLANQKHEFATAIDMLTDALRFCDEQFKKGGLPDRFEAASILSQIGASYYGIDTQTQGTKNKQQSLWYFDQSLEVYRIAIKNQIRFQPAKAEPIFVNAAYAYDYYGDRETALSLLDEVISMQDPNSAYGHRAIENCTRIKEELEGENQ